MAAPLLPLLAGAATLLNSVLDMFTGDKRRQAEVVLKQIEQAHTENMAQTEINKVEANHASIFVAGWRPSIGWVCSIGLASYFLPKHLLGAYFYCLACISAQEALPYNIDSAGLMELVAGLLGLGAFRTAEKMRGK